MRYRNTLTAVSVCVLASTILVGCGNSNSKWNMKNWFKSSDATTQPADAPVEKTVARQDVPEPVNLLLPQKISIHQFTGTRKFDEAGGVTGIDVRVQALDAFGEATKAFGDFRFEIYTFKPNSQDPKGDLWSVWEIEPSMLDAKENLRYWDGKFQMYQFKLQWDKAIPVGQKFVLVAVFQSPFTDRMITESVFVSGQ